jgi:hypothetical protein
MRILVLEVLPMKFYQNLLQDSESACKSNLGPSVKTD